MRAIWIIARNTFREIIRDRILYGIIVFALLLIGLSIALGELSFAEQARISADFGFTGIQLGAGVLSIFIGSTLVSREIEKQTILTLLARSITRRQFLLGKYLGLALVILVILSGLGVVLGGVVMSLGFPIGTEFFIALFGVLLEALLLIALSMFFGAFARPSTTVIFSASLFLLGHWVSSLGFFIEKSQSGSFKLVATVIKNVVPDLERFNWRSAPIYQSAVSATDVLGSAVYAIGWIVIALAAAAIIFRRRDFV